MTTDYTKLAELVGELRYVANWAEHHLDKALIINAAADAIESLIAERDALLNENSEVKRLRDAWQKEAQELLAERDALAKQKDGAYLERNKLVALLSKMFPAGKKKTAIEGWSEDWHGCVYIDLPTGQASWHCHDSQAELFAHLPEYQGTWDGHTTDEKYERIAAMKEKQE